MDIRTYFKRWPRFYYFVAVTFGPLFFGGLSPKKFLEKYSIQGKILNLGSGPQIVRSDVINIDSEKFPSVHFVAEIEKLPFEAASVDALICDNVLEHVRLPHEAVREMGRVLKTHGKAYMAVPFLYPFHLSPSDHTRWTKEGLIELFRAYGFHTKESGVRAGVFSALNVYVVYLFATILSFGSERLYWLLINIFWFVFFPIKLPDVVFNHWPRVHRTAAVLYWVFEKQ